MQTFNYSGVLVEVGDKKQAERLKDVLSSKAYTQRGLEQAAPGLMAAVKQEFKTCTDAGVRPEKMVVVDNMVRAELVPDIRRLKHGIQIGNR